MMTIDSTRNYAIFQRAITSAVPEGSEVGIVGLLERVKTGSNMAQQLVEKVTVREYWKILVEVGVCKSAVGAFFYHLFHWRTAGTYVKLAEKALVQLNSQPVLAGSPKMQEVRHDIPRSSVSSKAFGAGSSGAAPAAGSAATISETENTERLQSAVKLIYTNKENEFTAIDAGGKSLLVRISIDEKGVADFSQCENLQILNISGNTAVKTVKFYEHGINLKIINVTNCANLAEIDISAAVNLEEFRVKNNITIQSLKLPESKQLSSVVFRNCRNMETLDASQCVFKRLICSDCINFKTLKLPDEMAKFDSKQTKPSIYVISCRNLDGESCAKLHSISGNCTVFGLQQSAAPLR
jgi:hypothetical protein